MSSLAAKRETMSSTLTHNAYGKSGVRLTKVTRHSDRQEFKEITVNVQLEGDFALSYMTGDNSMLVATDSMRNTIYVLAAEHPLVDIEGFGRSLAKHFLDKYPQVSGSGVHIVEHLWQRIVTEGKPHAHSFVSSGNEKRTTTIHATRKNLEIESGIENLVVAKTTDSKFSGFIRDEYTTLADTEDRIFATNMEITWIYSSAPADYNKCYETIRQIALDVFAAHFSLAVQQTLNEIGEAVLKAVDQVQEITIAMPNQHRLAFNLEPLGKQNKNEIFYSVDEPFGLVTGTLTRKGKTGTAGA
jgi:urate oxidase